MLKQTPVKSRALSENALKFCILKLWKVYLKIGKFLNTCPTKIKNRSIQITWIYNKQQEWSSENVPNTEKPCRGRIHCHVVKGDLAPTLHQLSHKTEREGTLTTHSVKSTSLWYQNWIMTKYKEEIINYFSDEHRHKHS